LILPFAFAAFTVISFKHGRVGVALSLTQWRNNTLRLWVSFWPR